MKVCRSGALCAPYNKNKEGISLITLIITIIVIIILAAIVIFTGLRTPDSAQFSSFAQQVDNVQMAVNNKYADLKTKHAIAKEYRTDEQIYIEIARAVDPEQYASMGTTEVKTGENSIATGSTGIQNIDATKSTNTEHSIGMELPKVRENNTAWYVTKEGRVFNANGFAYSGKTYFDAKMYQDGELGSNDKANAGRALAVYDAMNKNTVVVTRAPEDGSAAAPTNSTTTDPEEQGTSVTPTSVRSNVKLVSTGESIATNATYIPGDEVQIGDEHFFVISDNGTELKLLAKYCLKKAGTEQVGNSAGYSDYGRGFSKTNYWGSETNLQSEAMITAAETDGAAAEGIPNAVIAAIDYGASFNITGITGRLMTYDEANGIKNGSDSNMKNILWGKWSDGTQPTQGYLYWWLGSASDSSHVWYVSGTVSDLYRNDSYNTITGVRPVLIVSESSV